MMRRLLLALFLFMSLMSSAQHVRTASGSYIYYAPQNLTVEQAKAVAEQRAKVQILADEFGTVVGVSNTSVTTNANGLSDTRFLSIGESEVRGEWLETIGKPKFDIRYEQDMLVVSVQIKGRVRELLSARTDLSVRVLRNGVEDKYESDRFKDEDYFYISFLTPVDGFVAVYLYDQSGVSRLLPLKFSSEGSQPVTGGERKVFFEQTARTNVDGRIFESVRSEYTLFCNGDNEMNRIYVIFSPNKFNRPVDDIYAGDDVPAHLSFDDFQKWLGRCRAQDTEMTVVVKDILIQK